MPNMPPSHHEQSTPPRTNSDMAMDMASQSRPSRTSGNMAQSAGIPQRLRNNDESWVEISSQPSSSSLSSINDEIVTTGLRVDSNTHRRRRRLQTNPPSRIGLEARQTNTSSQEEYEESESESDHLLSSNEHLRSESQLPAPSYSSDEDEEDDSTALGPRTFTPQPNAFSHPPSSSHNRPPVPGSYFPSAPRNPNPYTGNRRQHSYNATDHDAALRASLTTLLSIGAAAARGKRAATNPTIAAEPMGLRLVPESELLGDTVQPNTSRPLSPSTRARSSPSISSHEAIEKGKRKAAASGEKTKRRKRAVVAAGEVEDSTLFTWVVSAGVLVLVSVVGFGAGYVIGREVGRQEIGAMGVLGDGSCGREVVRGGSGSLRRFRWGIGGGGGRSVVA